MPELEEPKKVTNNHLLNSDFDNRCYGSLPTYSTKDFFGKLELASKEITRGVLLYTDEDNDLKIYIKYFFQEFHKLSGDWCKIFILEKPCKQWRKRNLPLTERFKLKFVRKIDKSEAYDIARQLKIDINQIPCLVLFGEEVNSQRLIFPIKPVSTFDFSKYFRELFSNIEKILFDVSVKNFSESPFETISCHFDDIINYLDKYAQTKSSQIQFSYQEQTIITEKLVIEDKSTSKTFNLQNAQIAGGLVDAETVNAHQIGGNIHNTNNQDRSN